MLIRSQDRSAETNLDQAVTTFIKENKSTGSYEIRIYAGNTYTTDLLGQYSTKEKAEEVLSEMEEMYIKESKHDTSCVFYMPDDDEVVVKCPEP